MRLHTLTPVFVFAIVVLADWTKSYEQNGKFKFDPISMDGRGMEEEINEHIRNLIEHFKQDDPVGLPKHLQGRVPDPIPIPDLQHDFSGARMTFEDLKVHGISLFRLRHVRSDLSALKASAGVSIDRLQVVGQYSMSTWFTASKGNCNVTIINVMAEAELIFMVDSEGFLQIDEINMDLKFEDIKMDFENLGILGRLMQGMVNSIGGFLFDSIKPMIMAEVQGDIRKELNREARSVPQQFPNSINPLDMAIASARNLIRERGLDPLPIPEYKAESWSTFELTDGYLQGLATIHRTGSIILGFENNSVQVTLHLGAENLKGRSTWKWGMLGGMLSRQGVMEFQLQYISAEVKMQQPANLDKLPTMEKIDLDVGNIAVLSDGAGTLDYIVEAIFNVLPNVFRKQIINSLEYPVCKAIEDEMKKINLEDIIEEHIEKSSHQNQ